MTIVAEDGTGLATADSYNDLAGVVALLAERGLILPAGTGPQNEAAARSATSYIDGHYTFVGQIKVVDQALAWPRVNAWDSEGRYIDADSVPLRVLRAHAFLTHQARLGDLEVVEQGTGGSSGAGGVSRERVTVGPITKETGFFQATESGGVATQKKFVEVDTLLRGLTVTGPGSRSGKLVRWS